MVTIWNLTGSRLEHRFALRLRPPFDPRGSPGPGPISIDKATAKRKGANIVALVAVQIANGFGRVVKTHPESRSVVGTAVRWVTVSRYGLRERTGQFPRPHYKYIHLPVARRHQHSPQWLAKRPANV